LDHSTGGGAGGSSLGLRIPNYFSNPSMIAGYHHHHQQQATFTGSEDIGHRLQNFIHA